MSNKRYMSYDGEGAEVGYLTLAEACEQYYDVEFDKQTGTITVGRSKAERDPRALIAALAYGVSVEDCTVTTVAALESGYDIDIDIAGDAPALLLPGWFADDGNAEVYFAAAEDGRAAAREYVEGGDWGERNRTDWIDVWVWRRALVLDEDGRVVTIEIDRDRHAIEIPPVEPDCTRDAHDWRERDVHGHGGGVIITEICVHCGRYRITDTWAHRRDTGEQGLRSVEYREPVAVHGL